MKVEGDKLGMRLSVRCPAHANHSM